MAARAALPSLRVALTGTGFIANVHMQALRRLRFASVVAVCDVDAAKAEAFARRWEIPSAYAAVEEMIKDSRPDVIEVLTPPPTHAKLAAACLRAGCHVFLEKPATVSAREAEDLRRAALETGRIVGVNHNAVFHPAFRSLMEEIAEWRLGRIESVVACVSVPLRQLTAGQHAHWMFQEPGNILLEQGPHPLSQILRLVGEPVEFSVLTSESRPLNHGGLFFATWQIVMRCSRGCAQCLLSFGREYADTWLHITGQDGAAHVDLRRNTLAFTGKTRFLPAVDDLMNSARSGLSLVKQGVTGFGNYALGFLGIKGAADPFTAGMTASVASFYQALRDGRNPPVTIDEGLQVVQACERIVAAAQHGRTLGEAQSGHE